MRAMYEKRFVLSLVSMNKHELDLDCNKVKTKNGKTSGVELTEEWFLDY